MLRWSSRRRSICVPISIAVVVATLLSGAPVVAAPSGGALPPPLTLVVQVAGEAGVPEDAVGVALNVTVTEPLADGFLTVYPCGDRPLASNLNFVAGQTVPNFVVAGLDAGGAVCIDTMSTTDVVVDLAGYIPADSSLTPLPAPVRFLDSRVGLGAPRQQVRGLTVTEVPLAGGFGVPADATSVVFNVTVVDPVADGYISVFPCDRGRLNNGGTSTSNFRAGEIVPNLVAIGVGEAGKVCVYSTVDTDLVADVAAFVPAGGAGLTTLGSPRRLVDTRVGVGGPAAPLDSNVRTIAVGGVDDVPVDATAAIVNITATDGSDAGYITAFPCGQPAPLVSNLNFSTGQERANMAVVALDPGGEMCMRAMVPVDVVVDITGYVDGTDALVAVDPTRLYDSRDGIDPPCGFAVRFRETRTPKTFELVSTVDGSTVDIPGQPAWTAPLSASIDPFCDVFLLGMRDGSQVLYRYSLGDAAGVVIAQGGNAQDVASSVRGAIWLGASGGADGGIIFDHWRGGVVASLPPNPVSEYGTAIAKWRLVGTTDDASLIVVTRQAEEQRAEVVVYDGDGQLLDTFKLAPGTLVTDISPDDAYLAVLTNYLQGGPMSLTVMTLDRTVVATLPNVFGARFTSAGSLAVCHQPPMEPALEKRWDLFSEPRPLGVSLDCGVFDVR